MKLKTLHSSVSPVKIGSRINALKKFLSSKKIRMRAGSDKPEIFIVDHINQLPIRFDVYFAVFFPISFLGDDP
jgi:hypothetical protein